MLTALSIVGMAQTINVLPAMLPAGGTHNDNVQVTCTFPEGCAGGKYWYNGGEIMAKVYDGPINIEASCRLSVAGINAQGQIITDVVTNDFTITKITPPSVSTSPEERSVRESFYVTTINWNNVETSEIDLSAFKEGGSRYKEKVVWLTYDRLGTIVASNDYNGLWKNGSNSFKAYLYKNYRPEAVGSYTLHIAKGVFVINGEVLNEELELKYYVGSDDLTAPVFSPEGGTFTGSVDVSITYPTSAFYKFYQIEGEARKQYTTPITLTKSATINAWGMNEDYTEPTETSTATFTILEGEPEKEILPVPVFSRNGNEISISASEGATVKYWMNNHMQNAKLYSGAITVSENCLISAVAYTEKGISPTADYAVTDLSTDDGEYGNAVITTPEDLETLFVTGMSPNGRFACGYTDTGGDPLGFVWDLTSNKFQYISTLYYNQALGVSNDGTIYGWRVGTDPTTGESSATSEDDLLWGYCSNGQWTRQPSGMTVNGITGDNKLFGSLNGKPVVYDIATQETMVYGDNGAINASSTDGSIVAGYVNVDGKKTAAYWLTPNKPTLIATERPCAVTMVSGNGEWMGLDNMEWGAYYDLAGYRHNRLNGTTETIVSNGAKYPSRYEWLTTITDDGSMYGVFDSSLISHDSGTPLVYTPEGIWRNVADVLREENIDYGDYHLLSSKFVTADQKTFVFTAFPGWANLDDAFKCGLVLRKDAKIAHFAPGSVEASQMYGLEVVKVSWEKPYDGSENVTAYKVLRNGEELAVVDAAVTRYYDHKVVFGNTYSYTVKAVYDDGKESGESYPCTVEVAMPVHNAVHGLTLRQSGINDINLAWQQPILTLPKLQYFNEQSEMAAFGTAGMNSEWAIRIPASDIGVYEGMDISTFQFLPTGPQASYELRLYKGSTTDRTYDATPFYTQSIDPSTLTYGTVNVIVLNTPQQLDINNDLLIALYIEQAGNENMLGVSYDGFRAGYTDLCRVEGVHDTFVSISESSSVKTEIVIPLGVGLGTEESISHASVSNFEIADNGEVVGLTSTNKYRIKGVSEGVHDFTVRALYNDGIYSEPTTINYKLMVNEEAFTPIDEIEVEVNSDNAATLSWNAPLNDDTNYIHWGSMIPREGLINVGYPAFIAASVYPVTMTNMFADTYQITHLYFYPTTSGKFTLVLDNGEDDLYAQIEVEPAVDELNIVKLETPVTVDASTNYRLSVVAENTPEGKAPLAFDNSYRDKDGYSNNVNLGYGWETLTNILQINDRANWLMGIVLKETDAEPLPLEGYDVILDGEKANSSLLDATTYTTQPLTEGYHTMAVNVSYDSTRYVEGSEQLVFIGTDGIKQMEAESAEGACYDLLGRRVIADKAGRGLFIIGGRKVVHSF